MYSDSEAERDESLINPMVPIMEHLTKAIELLTLEVRELRKEREIQNNIIPSPYPGLGGLMPHGEGYSSIG